jgi:AmiR/NasT family two-component response regulator
MLTFVKKDGGIQEAEEGYHDDKVMSIAIALQAVGQVVFPVEPIEVKPQYHFNVQRYTETQYDYGETMTIV